MEPAIKPAVEQSKTGKVLILATSMTLSSERYYHLLERFSEKSDFIHQACPGLVEIIENMTLEEIASRSLIEKYISPAINNEVDSIVLGCTHYPFLKKQMALMVGEHINIIETSEAVTRQVNKKLKGSQTQTIEQQKKAMFYSTGDLEHFKKQINTYWSGNIGEVRIL